MAALATDVVVFASAGGARDRPRLAGSAAAGGLPSVTHVLSVLIGLALLALSPRLWRGTRTAVTLSVAGIGALALLHLIRGRYDSASVEAVFSLLLALARPAFPVGCRNRPRPAVVAAAVGMWALTFGAVIVAPLVPVQARHALEQVRHQSVHLLRSSAAHVHLSPDWSTLIEVLIGCAAVISVLALRSLLRPAASADAHTEPEYRVARAIVARHGEDSLSPFLLRPDKALAFAAGGVLAYRLVGETAVVSGDPVAPEGCAAPVLARLLELAAQRGWRVALWGASDRHLAAYAELGLRAICVGEEAVVDPARFSLEGRAVRKLRQSVHRVGRRGWSILVREGRTLDLGLESEIDRLERVWRARQKRVLGFAMGMATFGSEVGPDDLYVLARSPEGELRAVMRFASHRGKLSLDTMRRVGETPNGLNEAMVCRALGYAREHDVREVSLNYAGLAHLVRGNGGDRGCRTLTRLMLPLLSRRFQMERLVRFNEKFSPEWRPRFLVYESPAGLPRAVVRTLQAEGYIPERRRRHSRGWRELPVGLPGSTQAKGAG